MTAPIRQEVDFQASPQRLYDALTDAEQFQAFSQQSAEIHREPGGVFKCFDGQISGRILDLVPNQRIVQAWRVGMWPEGLFSIVRFELKRSDNGTLLVMEHSGFPEEFRGHLEGGWSSMYWEPLKKALA